MQERAHVADPAAYPKQFERDATLKDGARVHLRPIRPDDEPRIVAFHGRLSEDTRYHRFFSSKERLPPDWAHFFANVDYHRRLALVGERLVAGEPELMGVGRYDLTEEGTAEVAFVVEDRWQDKGLGTMLFQDLLRAAETRGIRRFRAYVLADNDRMLRLISRYGQILEEKTERGVADILFTRREG
jgi:RimJ/RimL family protein N-acetyltransferase